MNSARPSWLTPSRIARAIASSGTPPIPVSGSGVRLGANTGPGMWLSAQGTSQPAPSMPDSTGAPCVFQSRSEWQCMQWASASTM